MIQEELTKEQIASEVAKATRDRSFHNILLIFLNNLIGFWFILPGILLLLALYLNDLWSIPQLPAPAFLRFAVGGALVLAGLALSLYSILLFAYYGDGMPIASLPPKRLVEQGPYACSRHPIYLGYSVCLSGIGVIVGSLAFLILVLPTFVFCWVLFALLYEEGKLQQRYGQAYAAYREKTPVMFSLRSWRSSSRALPGGLTPPFLYMLSAIVFRLYAKFFFDLEVSGEPHPDVSRPYVLVANHANYLDPFLINSCIRYFVRTSTTEKPFRNPLGRLYLKAVGAFPLARYKPYDVHSVRETLRLLAGGDSVGIFPEGERTWDGCPLKISDAVIRLLRKTGRPIIAINLSGNYNALPRWARWPRRSSIRIHFHEPFLFPRNSSLAEDRQMLEERLHSPGAGYDDSIRVKGERIAESLPLLLWRCPLCKTNDGLHVEQGLYLTCGRCGSSWKLQPDYRLKLLRSGSNQAPPSASTLSEWYDLIEENFTPGPLLPLKHPFLEDGEKVFLEGRAVRYSTFQGLKRSLSQKGGLVLTDRRLIFFNRRTVLSEDLSTIKKIVIQGNNELELGFDERMTSIRFHHESPLKWQAHISRIAEGACRQT